MSHMTPVDHQIKHKSTIPANAGDQINLFVREYKAAGSGGTPKPVLMLHGRSVPALPGFDLVLPAPGSSSHPDTRYSWAQALAGKGKGYDVYIVTPPRLKPGASRYAGWALRRTSPARRTLSAPTVSACAICPQAMQWNFSCVGRFSLAVCPQWGQVREVLRGSTAITFRPALSALGVQDRQEHPPSGIVDRLVESGPEHPGVGGEDPVCELVRATCRYAANVAADRLAWLVFSRVSGRVGRSKVVVRATPLDVVVGRGPTGRRQKSPGAAESRPEAVVGLSRRSFDGTTAGSRPGRARRGPSTCWCSQ